MTKRWIVNDQTEKRPQTHDTASQEAVVSWTNICGDRDPAGCFECTRRAGHPDIHVAGTGKGWICSWEDVQGVVGSLYVPPPPVPSSPKKAWHGVGAVSPPNPWQQNIAMPSPPPWPAASHPEGFEAVSARKAYRCDCGSRKTYGTLDYRVGHSDWCKGHPDREMENEVYD